MFVLQHNAFLQRAANELSYTCLAFISDSGVSRSGMCKKFDEDPTIVELFIDKLKSSPPDKEKKTKILKVLLYYNEPVVHQAILKSQSMEVFNILLEIIENRRFGEDILNNYREGKY